MTTKHTPGPWMAGKTANTWAKIYADGRCLAHIKPIHAAGARQAGDFDQEGANAHLIAAAPDLLAALKYMLCWTGDIPPSKSKTNPPSEREAVSRALAAIAKAKGEG